MLFLVKKFPTLLLLALYAWSLPFWAHADETPIVYTLDLPCQPNLATPTWLGHAVVPVSTFAELNLPLTTPQAGQALLVTLTFREKTGGFLRLIWQGAQGEQQVLTNNFYQGIGMANQRALLIPADVVQGSGTLLLQCGATDLGVQSISLEWLENQSALASPEKPDELVVSSLGTIASAASLDGQPPQAESAALEGTLVTVPVISAPERIEQGVQFGLQLDDTPTGARLSMKEAGLPWDQHLVLWINQQRAGTITPEVPDLGDSGFNPSLNGGVAYVGWRRASVYIPVSLLRKGINSVQFSAEQNDSGNLTATPPNDLPLAVEQVMAQFDYAAPAASTAAAGSSAPTATTSTPASSSLPSPPPSLSDSPAADLLTGPFNPTLRP